MEGLTIALLVPLLMAQEIPYTGPPSGYAIHHELPSTANTFKAVGNMPILSVATSYSIPVSAYLVNR